MTQPKLFSKPSLPTKASQELEIPPRLHPVVRDVVESLALRDVDCAKSEKGSNSEALLRSADRSPQSFLSVL